MSKFRIGLIGLGVMAQEHIRQAGDCGGFEFAAVCDADAGLLAKVGDQLNIDDRHHYTDFTQVIGDPTVDAVVSVTPNHVHADIVRACLLAGKPFMAEKPFTRIFEEAESLLKLYEQRPVPCMIGFSYRYTPAFRYARELVRSGRLGAIHSFSLQYLQSWGAMQYGMPYIWRFDKAVTGTGTLGDLGSHMIDMARYLFGEFEELSAQLKTIIPTRPDPATGHPAKVEVDDFASFQALLDNGAMGVFQTSRNAIGSGNQHEVSVYGETGTLHASTLKPDQLIWIHEEEPGQLATTTLEVPGRCKVTQWADFRTMLEGSVSDGLPGFMDGYRNQQVLDAIIRANAARAVIRLD